MKRCSRRGDHAPDFETTGISGEARDQYRLRRQAHQDNFVLLSFYPFDFSPVCTHQLCTLRDAEWFEFLDNFAIWGVSADSTYTHRAFADEYGIRYPLLSDDGGEIASRYGVKYDRWDGHTDIPKRALFVIDPDQTVAYAWKTDDAYHHADYWALKEAIDAIVADSASVVADPPDLPSDVEELLEPPLNDLEDE